MNENNDQLYYKELNNAIDSLDHIEEIGTIFSKKPDNKTPANPIHIIENYIGIENWASKQIFHYSYNIFKMNLENNQEWNKKNFLNVLKFTRGVLLFCNDCTTAWNNRKTVLTVISRDKQTQREFVKKCVIKELQFSRCIIRRNPKSCEAFAHRRWLLTYFKLLPLYSNNELLQNELVNKDEQLLLLENEINVCKIAGEWHHSNYNAWSHRTWLATKLIDAGLEQNKLIEILSVELKKSFEFIEKHVSDHSPVSYIQFIMKKIIEKTSIETWMPIWKKYFHLCTELLILHEGKFESLWFNRRQMLLILSRNVPDKDKSRQFGITLATEKIFCKTFALKEKSKVVSYMKFIDKFIFRNK